MPPLRPALVKHLLLCSLLPGLLAGGCGHDGDLPPGTLRLDAYGAAQVWVPAGSFMMGTADTVGLRPPRWAVAELATEMPAHKVTLTHGYWIDAYEVTNGQYNDFVESNGYRDSTWWSPAGWAWLQGQTHRAPKRCSVEVLMDKPRVCVNWYEAEAYAHWRGGRLPTEAEWEYAARGPASLRYPWGEAFSPDMANIIGAESLKPVGSFPEGVSWVGAYDMAGNAMEWVQDWLDPDYYRREDRFDPQGPPSGRIKIEKGGWWDSHPFVARSAYRHFEDPPEYRDHHIGFRIVTPEME